MPPNFTGYYQFVSQDNMDNYLRVLDINVALRKLVCLLKPDKEIIHNGNHMTIRTLTTLRNYIMDFDLGTEFEEDLGPVDGRKCQISPVSNNSLVWLAGVIIILQWWANLALQMLLDYSPHTTRKKHPATELGIAQTTVNWNGDELVCQQRGEKKNRGWKQWLEGDRLHLHMMAEGETCVQVFQKVK